jgi:hypothetical protein
MSYTSPKSTCHQLIGSNTLSVCIHDPWYRSEYRIPSAALHEADRVLLVPGNREPWMVGRHSATLHNFAKTVPTIDNDRAYNIQRQSLQYTKTVPTIYKDSPCNIQRQCLQYTMTELTIYKDSPYNIQWQSLQYTKTVPTIYKDSPYNIQRQCLQ